MFSSGFFFGGECWILSSNENFISQKKPVADKDDLGFVTDQLLGYGHNRWLWRDQFL